QGPELIEEFLVQKIISLDEELIGDEVSVGQGVFQVQGLRDHFLLQFRILLQFPFKEQLMIDVEDVVQAMRIELHSLLGGKEDKVVLQLSFGMEQQVLKIVEDQFAVVPFCPQGK